MAQTEISEGSRKGIWRSFRRVAFSVLLSLSLVATPVFAISSSTLYWYGQNNILYFDPDAGCIANSYILSSISGSDITWIGDSYSVGAKSYIDQKFAGVDYGASVDNTNSYIQTSKSFSTGTSENPGGLSVLDSIISAGKLRKVLVYALGTNDQNARSGTFAGWIDQIMSKVGNTKVVFVTSYVTAGGHDYSYSNADIIAAASKYTGQVTVADWAAVATPEYYSQNNLHPYGHYDEWTDVIKKAIPAVTASATFSTDNNASDNISIILGYLMQQGYSLDAAAGIVGNLWSESAGTFNPKILQGGAIVEDGWRAIDSNGNKTFSGGFGLAQWTSIGRVRNLQQYADDHNLPVTSLQLQVLFLVHELNGYGLGPSVMNQYGIEEATWVIYRSFERPASAIYTVNTSPSADNDEVPPLEYSRLNPAVHRAAYNASLVRINHAKETVGITPTSDLSFGINNCATGALYLGEVPQYFQTDSRWSSSPFGSSTIGAAGCGPTSFAMMATGLLGKTILPDEVAAKVPEYYVPGAGASHAITQRLAELYGLEYENISTNSSNNAINTINKYLRNGWMIHTTGAGSKPFSSGGHYIGIYGITADGKWQVADSAYGNAEYTPNEVIAAGMNIGNIRAIRNPNYVQSASNVTGQESAESTTPTGYTGGLSPSAAGISVNNSSTIDKGGLRWYFPLSAATKNNYLRKYLKNIDGIAPQYVTYSGGSKAGGFVTGPAGWTVLSTMPCPTTSCHHDDSIGRNLDLGINVNGVAYSNYTTATREQVTAAYGASTGANVRTMTDVKITNVNYYKNMTECMQISMYTTNGYYLYYTHMAWNQDLYDRWMAAGKQLSLSAGTYVGRVGTSKCTGNGSQAHLHVNSAENVRLVPLMNELFDALPEGAHMTFVDAEGK